MNQPFLLLDSPTLRYIGVTLDNPHRITLPVGITVVIGPNGSGKSTLARIIEKGWNITTNSIKAPGSRPSVKVIEFNDIHSLTGAKAEYYQQRHEATMNDEVPAVATVFADKIGNPLWKHLCDALRLTDIADKRINFLSSGELRKLLIINALMDRPDLLILDNPYIGLDAPSRHLLDEAIADISSHGTNVMLLICDPDEIPEAAHTVIPMHDMTIGRPIDCDGCSMDDIRAEVMPIMDYTIDLNSLPEKVTPEGAPFEIALDMRDCNVTYGSRAIITRESWTVRRGERWALSGPNGSGKSVLLSLINADNPQAYHNDITLFDRRRGTGESIWDIKRRIGYVSPEMHLFFRHTGTLTEVVAQGLRDTVGGYGRIPQADRDTAMRWLAFFGMQELADRRYSTLSAGQQRLALIARSLIKQPDLLILDEPLHGLDAPRKRAVRAVIDRMARLTGCTLIYVTHCPKEVPQCVTLTKRLKKLQQ